MLGHLEAAVMEIIWRQEEASVRDVYETLLQNRQIAYTTVMTIMGWRTKKSCIRKRPAWPIPIVRRIPAKSSCVA